MQLVTLYKKLIPDSEVEETLAATIPEMIASFGIKVSEQHLRRMLACGKRDRRCTELVCHDLEVARPPRCASVKALFALAVVGYVLRTGCLYQDVAFARIRGELQKHLGLNISPILVDLILRFKRHLTHPHSQQCGFARTALLTRMGIVLRKE